MNFLNLVASAHKKILRTANKGKNVIILPNVVVLLSASSVFAGGTLTIDRDAQYSISDLTPYDGILFELENTLPHAATLTIDGFSSASPNAISAAFAEEDGVGSITLSGTASNQVVELPGLSNGLSSIQGIVTVDNCTLQGNTSPNASLSLENSGAAYNLGSNQAITDLTGATGSTIDLGANILTIASGGGNTFSGNITGSGGLVLNGQATLTLNGTNTYTGNTTINDSSTLIGTIASLSTSKNIQNDSILTLTQPPPHPGNFESNINGIGILNIEGNGTIILKGETTHTNGTQIFGASTLEGTTETLPTASGITLFDTSSVNFYQSSPGTYAQAITGSGGVFIQQQGQITFTGANSYTGGNDH